MTSTANPNTPNDKGQTPIHYAAWRGHLEIIRLLMTATDGNLIAQDIFGRTPIDVARQFGHSNIVEKLKMFT